MVDNNNTKAEIFEEFKRLIDEAYENGIAVPEKVAACNGRSTKADLLSAIKLLEKSIKNRNSEKSVQLSIEDFRDNEPEIEPKPQNRSKVTDEQANIRFAEDEELKLLNQDIIDKVHSLEKAKAIREQEYSALLEFEAELEKTVFMLNSMNDRFLSEKSEHDTRLKEEALKNKDELIALETELEDSVNKARSGLEKMKTDFKELKSALDSTRSYEEEAFLYEQKTIRNKEDDAWEDEKSRRIAALRGLEEEITRLKDELSEKETLIPELKDKLDKLPEQLKKAREEGAAEKEQELKREFEHRAAIIKMDAEAGIKSYERKIESLREDFEAMKTERNMVRDKLDKAYEESNKLYLQTIQSTGGVKIISNLDKK